MHATHGRGVVLLEMTPRDVMSDTVVPLRFRMRYATPEACAAAGRTLPPGAAAQVAAYDPATHLVTLQTIGGAGPCSGFGLRSAGASAAPLHMPAVVGPFESIVECGAAGCTRALVLSALAQPMKRCAQCRIVAYCSLACQRADWAARHRYECAPEPPAGLPRK